MDMEGFPAEKKHRNSTEGLEMTGITKAFLQKFGKTQIQLGQKEQTHLQQDNDLKNGTHRVGCASSYSVVAVLIVLCFFSAFFVDFFFVSVVLRL